MTKIKLIKSPNKYDEMNSKTATANKVGVSYGENVFKIKSLYSKEDVILDYEDLTMGTMVFGSTGSGKTTTVMYPLVDRFLRDGHSGVILDVKGDYASFIRSNGYADNVLFLSDTKDSLKINVLEGIDRNEFRDLLKGIIPRTRTDEFWGTSAIASCMLIYDLHQCLYKQTPSLSVLHEYLVNPAKLARKTASYLKSEYAEKISVDLKNSIEALLVDNFSCLRYGAYLESEELKSKSNYTGGAHASEWVIEDYGFVKASEQYTWHHSGLIEVLSPFAKGSALGENFCSSEPLSIGDFIYRVKKTIVVDLPKSQYGSAADFICKLIKNRLYKAVFSYDLEYRKQNEYGSKNYTFLFIDEYQDHKEFNTSSKYNDNNFVDKSRQYGHINVFSTQGISSLLSNNVSDSTYGVYSFLQNMRNMIVLGGSCIETMRHVSNLEGWDPMDELKFPKEMGVAYVYSGKNKHQKGGAVHKLCKLGVYHNDFIGKSYLRETNLENVKPKTELVDNNYFSINKENSKELKDYHFENLGFGGIVYSSKEDAALAYIIDSYISEYQDELLKFFDVSYFDNVLSFNNLCDIYFGTEKRLIKESVSHYFELIADLDGADKLGPLSSENKSNYEIRHKGMLRGFFRDLNSQLETHKAPELMSLYLSINAYYPNKNLNFYISTQGIMEVWKQFDEGTEPKILFSMVHSYCMGLANMEDNEYSYCYHHVLNLFAVFKEMKRRKTKLNFNFPKN